MDDKKMEPASVDAYISQFPAETQALLQAVRTAIREAAPDAQETISYQMPAYMQNGPLVYFAAFSKHIGFFPTPEGVEAFTAELSEYKTSKGTIQFPYKNPIPLDLIKRITTHRVGENAKRPMGKK